MKYEQLVVCQGLDYKDRDEYKFKEIFKKHHFHKPKIVGVVETLPSKDEHGNIIIGTGGRKDFFFFLDNKDINKFGVWRLSYGMKWFEELFDTNEYELYPDEFIQKYPKRW